MMIASVAASVTASVTTMSVSVAVVAAVHAAMTKRKNMVVDDEEDKSSGIDFACPSYVGGPLLFDVC